MQEVKKADFVIEESLRVAGKIVVGFPNFAYIKSRVMLFFQGRSPITPSLPYHWYDTPNVRFLSISDFTDFSREKHLRVLASRYLDETGEIRWLPNLRALNAIFVLANSRIIETPAGMTVMNKKAFALLSGGLDSALAVKMILDQGVEIEAVNFMSPFCNCTPKTAGCKRPGAKARRRIRHQDPGDPQGDGLHENGRAPAPRLRPRDEPLHRLPDLHAAEGPRDDGQQKRCPSSSPGRFSGRGPCPSTAGPSRSSRRKGGSRAHPAAPVGEVFRADVIPNKRESLTGRTARPQRSIEKATDRTGREAGDHRLPRPAGGCLLTDREIAVKAPGIYSSTDPITPWPISTS